MLPEPSRRRIVAAGFAHLADPRHLCSAVHPRGAAFGLAPRSRRNDGQLEVRVAGGEQERVEARFLLSQRHAAGRSRGIHRQRLVERRRRRRAGRDAASMRPSRAANSSGVKPLCDLALTSAPAAIERAHDVGVPLGGGPHQRRLLPRTARRRSRSRRARAAASTTSATPVRAAVISAVSPSGCAVLGSAPALSSSSTSAALPPAQASESGRTP